MRSPCLLAVLLVGLQCVAALPTRRSHVRLSSRSPRSQRRSTQALTLRSLLNYFSPSPSASEAFAPALIAGDVLNFPRVKRAGEVRNPKSRRAVAAREAAASEMRFVRRSAPVVLDAPSHDSHSTLFTFESSHSHSHSARCVSPPSRSH